MGGIQIILPTGLGGWFAPSPGVHNQKQTFTKSYDDVQVILPVR